MLIVQFLNISWSEEKSIQQLIHLLVHLFNSIFFSHLPKLQTEMVYQVGLIVLGSFESVSLSQIALQNNQIWKEL